MYTIIEQIIAHQWVSNYNGDQQYIYYTAAALICILTVAFIDAFRTLFRAFCRK